jgi:uncharacterized protein (DUF305 family)
MQRQAFDRRASRTVQRMRVARLFLLAGLGTLGLTATPPVAGEHSMGAAMLGPDQAGRDATTPFATMMETAMTVMDSRMKGAPMSGDPDHDFAAMMIPHHQGAIDMAKAELLYGKNPVLRRLAQEIIVTQSAEITVMQEEIRK